MKARQDKEAPPQKHIFREELSSRWVPKGCSGAVYFAPTSAITSWTFLIRLPVSRQVLSACGPISCWGTRWTSPLHLPTAYQPTAIPTGHVLKLNSAPGNYPKNLPISCLIAQAHTFAPPSAQPQPSNLHYPQAHIPASSSPALRCEVTQQWHRGKEQVTGDSSKPAHRTCVLRASWLEIVASGARMQVWPWKTLCPEDIRMKSSLSKMGYFGHWTQLFDKQDVFTCSYAAGPGGEAPQNLCVTPLPSKTQTQESSNQLCLSQISWCNDTSQSTQLVCKILTYTHP